jgi:hypothetical protein
MNDVFATNTKIEDKKLETYRLLLGGTKNFGPTPGNTNAGTFAHAAFLRRDMKSFEIRDAKHKMTDLIKLIGGASKLDVAPLATAPFGAVSENNTLYVAGAVPKNDETGPLAISQFLMPSNLDPTEIKTIINTKMKDSYEWINGLKLPPSPKYLSSGAFDANQFFNKSCLSCHNGVSNEAKKYQVGTDPQLEIQNEQILAQLKGSLLQGIGGKGYSARKLSGLAFKKGWMHNGSIPNCEAFMKIGKQGRYWREKDPDPTADCQKLREGNYPEKINGQIQDPVIEWTDTLPKQNKKDGPSREQSSWYDTKAKGQSNADPYHSQLISDEFDRLKGSGIEEKRKFCEYLKSL